MRYEIQILSGIFASPRNFCEMLPINILTDHIYLNKIGLS